MLRDGVECAPCKCDGRTDAQRRRRIRVLLDCTQTAASRKVDVVDPQVRVRRRGQGPLPRMEHWWQLAVQVATAFHEAREHIVREVHRQLPTFCMHVL